MGLKWNLRPLFLPTSPIPTSHIMPWSLDPSTSCLSTWLPPSLLPASFTPHTFHQLILLINTPGKPFSPLLHLSSWTQTVSGTPPSCFQNISILTVHVFIYSPTTLSRTLLCARHKGQGKNQKGERSMESQRGMDSMCPLEVPTGRSLCTARLLHWAVSRKDKILLVIILLPGLPQCLAIIFFFLGHCTWHTRS